RAEVYLNPGDAAALGLADGDSVRVTSRRGTIVLWARVSHREAPGNCFIPFHFREAAANLLTTDEIDPVGKIPEFKFCAVRIEATGATGAPGRGRPDGQGTGPASGRRGQAGCCYGMDMQATRDRFVAEAIGGWLVTD